MKKNTVIVVIVLLLLVILAVAFFAMKKGKMSSEQSSSTPTQQSPLSFTSMKDLLSKTVSIQCTYTTDQGMKAETYVKNGAVRSNYVAVKPDQSQNVIIKENKMYSWNDTTKQGMVLSFDLDKITPPAENPAGKTVPTDKSSSPYEALQEIEKFKQSCKPAVVSDSLFTPPKDVNFIDFMQQMNDMKKNIPSPGATSGSMNEEQIKKMMEQYQNTSSQTSGSEDAQ